ncbi:MAG: hypothetical protein KAX55_00125 [Propionivibrio sp.]|nr:hypothetical protein [Propionivibrio sp.]
MNLDPRIGKLNGGKFYCFPDGYGKPEFIGTLEEVGSVLGLSPAVAADPEPAAMTDPMWTVTLRFQYPAWDEAAGILYQDIRAASKAEANAIVRRMADNDGHLQGGKGRVTFTATEQ